MIDKPDTEDLIEDVIEWLLLLAEARLPRTTCYLTKDGDRCRLGVLRDVVASTNSEPYEGTDTKDKFEPDWSKVPEGYDWVATDYDGAQWAYRDNPIKHQDLIWEPWGEVNAFKVGAIGGPVKDWEDSLRQRPKTKPVPTTDELVSVPTSWKIGAVTSSIDPEDDNVLLLKAGDYKAIAMTIRGAKAVVSVLQAAIAQMEKNNEG